MSAVSRMKATFLNPKFSPLFPHLRKTKYASFAHLSRITESFICNNPIRFPSNLNGKSTPFLSSSFICSTQNGNLQMEASRPPSGEIHVIVGPMFAGKTTTLLRRIQLESSNCRMRRINLRPDQYTFASMFRACATLAALEPWKQAYAVMVKCQIRKNATVSVMRMPGMTKEPSYSKIEVQRSVAIIKSSKDTRYGLDSVVTHDGMKFPCWALKNLSSFRQNFGLEAYEQLDVIGIDEAQFFEDLYDFCCEAADHDGKTVIVAGLDGNYLRKKFGSVLDIIPLADSVTKLTARCEICGKRAFFTLRKTEETQVELIGGADVYMPVCRHHYVSGQVAVEAARHVLESQKLECGSYT